MTVQVIMNIFSCAKEVYKIAIIRWRIDALLRERGIVSRVTSRDAIPVYYLIGSFERPGRLSADRAGLAGPPDDILVTCRPISPKYRKTRANKRWVVQIFRFENLTGDLYKRPVSLLGLLFYE